MLPPEASGRRDCFMRLHRRLFPAGHFDRRTVNRSRVLALPEGGAGTASERGAAVGSGPTRYQCDPRPALESACERARTDFRAAARTRLGPLGGEEGDPEGLGGASERGRSIPRGLVILAIVELVACGRIVTRPGSGEGTQAYWVGGLSFEAPSTWHASGGERRLRLVAPAGDAAIEASAVAEAGSLPECLASAEAALARGENGLTAVQRHSSSFAGQRAVAQEADQGAWHGWAWALCAEGMQYRVWFAGRSPLSRELLEVQRRLAASARLGAPP